MTETYDQKYERLKKDSEESTRRINKLLCERDLQRDNRFWDKKNKLMHSITLGKYRLEKLEREASPIRKEIAKLEAELKQVESDHENYLDSIWTTPTNRFTSFNSESKKDV